MARHGYTYLEPQFGGGWASWRCAYMLTIIWVPILATSTSLSILHTIYLRKWWCHTPSGSAHSSLLGCHFSPSRTLFSSSCFPLLLRDTQLLPQFISVFHWSFSSDVRINCTFTDFFIFLIWGSLDSWIFDLSIFQQFCKPHSLYWNIASIAHTKFLLLRP